MRSPSPRRRQSPERKRFFQRRPSPGQFKRNRSRSMTPPTKRRPIQHVPHNRRSRSPVQRRRNSRGRTRSRSRSPFSRSSSRSRSRSFRKRSRTISRGSSRSRSPRQKSPKRKPRDARNKSRSRSRSRERYKPKAMKMNRAQNQRDDQKRRFPSGPQSGARTKGKFSRFSSSPENLPGPTRNRSASGKQGKPEPVTDFDPYRDNSGGRGDKDYRTLPPTIASKGQGISSASPGSSVPTRPKERFDQTAVSISDRFLNITGLLPPFSPTENVTIGIERSIPGNSPATIPQELFPSEVILVRRKEEGIKPLHQRTEFLGPKEEVAERRTIKVQPTEEPKHKQKIRVGSGKGRPMLTDRWTVSHKGEEGEEIYKKQGMTREEMDDFLLSPTVPPMEASSKDGDRDDRFMESSKATGSRSGPIRGHDIDRDERVVLDKREKNEKARVDYKFTVNIQTPSDADQDLRFSDERDRFERDPNDLRHNLSKKKKSSKSEKDDSFDARQKLLKKRENELRKREAELKKRSAQLEKKEKLLIPEKKDPNDDSLPDFSNRPDKYQNDYWKEHPELTPKGSAYYEVKPKFNPQSTSKQSSKYNKPQSDTDKVDPGRRHSDSRVGGSFYQHDNREFYRGRGRGRGFVYRGRGRGSYEDRGGGRGGGYQRGGYRGGFRGYQQRGGYKTTFEREPRGLKKNHGEYNKAWTHDKFEEIDDEKEEKPSSTTKI